MALFVFLFGLLNFLTPVTIVAKHWKNDGMKDSDQQSMLVWIMMRFTPEDKKKFNFFMKTGIIFMIGSFFI